MGMRFLSTSMTIGGLVLVTVSLQAASPFALLPLKMLWRVQPWANNYMSTLNPYECQASPLCEAVMYVPNPLHPTLPISGSVSGVWRFFNGWDHADYHASTTCCGYSVENAGQPFYFGWSSSTTTPGLSEVQLGVNPATGDRATYSSWLPIGGAYSMEFSTGRWGYARNLGFSEYNLETSAGGVTVQSNAVAGGATWRWTHQGVQYLNMFDYGRQMQSALFFCDWPGPTACFNPTEAGDVWSYHWIPAYGRHGSPIATFVAEPGSGTPTQVTRAIPLEYSAFAGPMPGSQYFDPVLYRDLQMGKDLTLNWSNLGPVARYRTALFLPGPLEKGLLQVPFIAVNGFVSRFWTYDVFTNALVERFPPCGVQSNNPSNPSYWFGPGSTSFSGQFGGVVLSSADGSKAMGLFGQSRVSDPQSGFDAFSFTDYSSCGTGGTHETDARMASMDATIGRWDLGEAGSRSFPSGWSNYNSWVTTGTLGEVVGKFEAICSAIRGTPC